MTNQEARILRQKFYDGTSTPADEQALRRYVCSPRCPEGWEAERRLFAALAALTPPAAAMPPEAERPATPAEAAFEQRLVAALNAAAEAGNAPAAPPQALNPKAEPARPERPPRGRVSRRLRWALQAAIGTAAAVAVVWAGFMRQAPPAPTVYADTFATPEEAARAMDSDLGFIGNELHAALTTEQNLGGPMP